MGRGQTLMWNFPHFFFGGFPKWHSKWLLESTLCPSLSLSFTIEKMSLSLIHKGYTIENYLYWPISMLWLNYFQTNHNWIFLIGCRHVRAIKFQKSSLSTMMLWRLVTTLSILLPLGRLSPQNYFLVETHDDAIENVHYDDATYYDDEAYNEGK